MAEKKFHVKYIDLTTGRTEEETIPEIEQYDLYKRQREGKISIISIHYVTEGMTQTSDPLLFRRLRKRLKERREERKKRVTHAEVMTKEQAKKYYKDILDVDEATAEKLANEYIELLKKYKKEGKSSGSNLQTTPAKNIVDLVRSQFNFSCPICEEIAEKVSTNFPDRVTQTRIYEAVYKLSSQDRKAQDEAMITLEKLGVLEQVIAEVEQGWESLKK